jgi:hypothetical protein
LCRFCLDRPFSAARKSPRLIIPEQKCVLSCSLVQIRIPPPSPSHAQNPRIFPAKRPVSATLSASGRGIGYKSAKEARKSCTVPEPFSFDNRERFKKKPIVQLRLEQEMLERLEIEQIEYSQV